MDIDLEVKSEYINWKCVEMKWTFSLKTDGDTTLTPTFA